MAGRPIAPTRSARLSVMMVAATAVVAAACAGSGGDGPSGQNAAPSQEPTTVAPSTPDPSPATVAQPPGATTTTGSTPAIRPRAVEAPDGEVDLVLTGGIIVTMADPAEVAAIAIDGNLIVAIGDEQDVLSLGTDRTAVVDLAGLVVFPGFIDAHSHWYQPNRIGDYGPEQINQVLLSRGWTGTNDVNVEPHFADQLFGWAEQSRIGVRMNAYLSLNTPGTDQDRHGDWYDAYELAPGDMLGDRLRIVGVKVFVGSDWDRVLKWTQPELDEVIATHAAQGWQIAAKQISDDSLDMSLSAFEALGPDTADRRHRLEHALEMRADQIPRVRRAGLVPVVQLGGLEADQWLEDGFLDITGDDGTDAVWPFRDMLDAGLPLVGSIAVAPAEGVRSAFTISVMQMLHGALTGISEIGNPPWPGRESQLMSADEALRTITTMAAFSTFEEDQRGSLQVGMLADLVVMSDDLRSAQADPDLLFDTQVVATLVDGELMWCGFGHDEWCATLGQELPARLLEEATLQPLVEGDLGPTAEPDPPGVGDVRVTASSFSSDFPPHLAVDGRTEFGGWVAAAPPPGWIEIDLGQPSDITKIELWVDQDPATASHHRVYGGPDPEPTELLGELLGETTWGQILTIEGNWSVRHLRIETLESTPTYGWLEVAVNGS